VIKVSRSQHRGTGGRGGSAPEARPAEPHAGGEAASTRLDKWTSYVRPHRGTAKRGYRMAIRDYGDGAVDATVTIDRPVMKRKGSHVEGPHKQPTESQVVENMQRAVARAKTTIKRSILAANLDHMLTLTYRENMLDEVQAWNDFGKLTRLVKKRRPKWTFPFVAVQERQERGAIHIHAAVHGFQDVALLRCLWHQVIGGPTKGNIDVQHFAGARHRLAKYLCKYLVKDFGEDTSRGTHRYKRSRGIVIPEQIVLLPPHAAVDSEVIEAFESRGTKVKFHKNRLTQEGPKWLWACSW